MNRVHQLRVVTVIVAASLVLGAFVPASAQKKRKEGKASPDPSAQVVPAEGQHGSPAKAGATIREVLIRLQGHQTNLGVVTKVTGDYVMFENDGDTLIYPLNILQMVKFTKPEEGETRKIEIRFLAKD